MKTAETAATEPKMVSGAEHAKKFATTQATKFHIKETYISCGVYQLSYLYQMAKGTPGHATGTDHIVAALNKVVPKPTEDYPLGYFKAGQDWCKCAFFVFSDNDQHGNGIALAKFIIDNNLGSVTETSEVKVNPNSKNPIRVWVWAPDHQAVRDVIDNHQWGVGIPDRPDQTKAAW